MAALPRQHLGQDNAFVLGLVREHRPGDDIADGVNTLDVRFKKFVGFDAFALIQLHAGFSSPRPSV
jgi:hypothetical protein